MSTSSVPFASDVGLRDRAGNPHQQGMRTEFQLPLWSGWLPAQLPAGEGPAQFPGRGTQRCKQPCCDVPTRGFLAPGFAALGFIYSGSANSQDESETKCFIKKESIII